MANPFDEIDPRSGGASHVAPSAPPASSNPFDDIDPKGGMAATPPAPSSNPPEMFLSTDPSGRMVAAPSTNYNLPERTTGVIQRAREGAAGPMESEHGFSSETLSKYPWLKWAQPYAKTLDVAIRTPASIWGGASGAVAGAAEPIIGKAQADRLQRDVNVLPMAVAPEAPMAAPEINALRAPKAEVRPPVRPPPVPEMPPPLPPEVSAIPRQVDRPNVGVGLLNTDVEHALPAAHSRALSAAGNGGPLAGMSPETIAHLRQTMADQGFTPHTIDQRLSEMSAHHFFGEITPSLEADMGAMAAPPGAGKLEVLGSIRQRAAEARERVQHTFDRAFGVNENVAELRRIMEGDRAQASQPFYQAFRETMVSPTPEIERLMPRLEASGALRDANRKLAMEGQPARSGFIDMEGQGAGEVRVPTAQAFQYAKEYLDKQIEAAMAAPGGMNDARIYTNLKNTLVEALDNHPRVGNIWRESRTTYAQPSEIMDAMQLGRRVLTQHIDANELPFLTSAYSEAQMRGLRIGMRAHLEQMLGKRGNLTQETLNTVLSPNNIDKMRWAIGDRATESLVSAMEHEAHMHGAPTRVHGGSPTAHRLEAQKRWTAQDEAGGITIGDVAGALKHPIRSGTSAAMSTAEKFGLGRRKAANEARMARLREEASRIYTLQGPERDAVARYLVEGPSDVPRKSGGRVVHNHNPSEAQKKAGNYAKTHKFFQGLDITLENLKGKARSGVGRDGKKWSVKMPADYGYIKRTEGADGDHVDVYLGPNDKSDQVFVVDQKDAETGKFDEHKCLLGFSSEKEARATYRAGFSDGKDRIKHIRRMSMAEFREWLSKGDTSKEIRRYAKGGAVKRAVEAVKKYAEGGAPEDDGGTFEINKPFGELSAGPPRTPSEWVGDKALDVMTGVGMKPHVARHLKEGVGGILGWTPLAIPMAAADLIDAKRRDDIKGVAIAGAGMIPGARGVARRVAEEAGSAVSNVAKRSTEIPNIREMATDEAIKVARKQPHLIKAGDQSEGFYVGGPREVQSKRALTKLRKAFDDYVAADPRGGDWYDRYRAAVNEVTGGDPVKNKWMSNQEGQWSAGVSPEGELGFALKENNAEIAGMPVKSARPAQHEAHQRAIEAQDPSKYQLGDKTGEYARLVNPDQVQPPGATGVNDFRHARNWGYTEAGPLNMSSPVPQKNALTSAQHKFLDYETALAVDRANKTNLGGRSDWTGEKLQAAPWVRQKAIDMSERYGIPYEEAFELYANKTIGDYFGKHTAFATHEAMPGADTGHLAGSITAPAAEREAFSRDPRSTWATAPGGRDAIYSGMGIEGTGNFVRTRPSTEMQGLYTPPGGATETNVGWTARPLVAFDSGKTKSVAPADRALLDAGEATRGYIDAQNASAWHKPWAGGAPGESNSLFMPMDRKATAEELLALQKETGAHGLSDVVDTGRGVTATRFYPPPEDIGKAIKKDGLVGAIRTALPDARMPERVKVDSGYIDYTPKWQEGVGSGAATRELLEHIGKTPRLRAAMSNNPDIPKAALARLERDEEWASKWGATREDIQNARRIIGKGTGWVERLEAALKKGALLPAAALAVFGTAAQEAFPERS